MCLYVYVEARDGCPVSSTIPFYTFILRTVFTELRAYQMAKVAGDTFV